MSSTPESKSAASETTIAASSPPPSSSSSSASSSSMHRIFLFGASGRTGQLFLNSALQKGHEVTAFVRNPSKLSLAHHRLKVVGGSVYDADSIRNALNDANKSGKPYDWVVSTLTSDEKPHDTCSRSSSIVVDAMKAGIAPKNYMVISSVGIEPGSKEKYFNFFERTLGNFFLLFFKGSAEDRAKEAKLFLDTKKERPDFNIRAISPPFLTNGPETGKYETNPDKPGIRVWSQISRADMSHFMIDLLDKPVRESIFDYIYYP